MKCLADREHVRIAGRTTTVGDILYLGFSGSFIEFETKAAQVRVTFCTDEEVPEATYRGWAAVLVDDGKEPVRRLALAGPKQTMTVFSEKTARKVKLRIVKMSEAAFGLVGIQEIETESDAPVIPTQPLERRIEFIGDSITCGYGNEGVLDRDVFCTEQENPLDAYAILTADALQAEYQLVSWSGIGIITNWVPETAEEPAHEIWMPELFPYRDRRLCEKLGLPLEEWDASEFMPDLVVIHLGTNDDSYVRNKRDREEYFGQEFYAFLQHVHENRPGAAILCALGVMGQNLCDEEKRQVERFKQAHPEVRADFVTLPQQKEEDGIGADSHPSKVTHRKTAAILTEKIREFMSW